MKEYFVNLLIESGLYNWFLDEFGQDWESYYDGWFFTEDAIVYRAADLFDPHCNGYDWCFYTGDERRLRLHNLLIADGFINTHNSGDEEDALYVMELAI